MYSLRRFFLNDTLFSFPDKFLLNRAIDLSTFVFMYIAHFERQPLIGWRTVCSKDVKEIEPDKLDRQYSVREVSVEFLRCDRFFPRPVQEQRQKIGQHNSGSMQLLLVLQSHPKKLLH